MNDYSKLREEYLKTRLPAKEASKLLETWEKEAAQKQKEKENQEFLSGLWLRNMFAFMVFLIILIALANQL